MNIKKNNKGLTLVELLAVIIILGVILTIAVPSVSGYIVKSKVKTYTNNLIKFADGVMLKVASGDYRFSSSQTLVVPFDCINLEKGNSSASPFGNYIREHSFVLATKDEAGFHYYISALDSRGYGTVLTNANNISVDVHTSSEVATLVTDANGYSLVYGSASFDLPNSLKVITCSTFVPTTGTTTTSATGATTQMTTTTSSMMSTTKTTSSSSTSGSTTITTTTSSQTTR